MYSSPLLPLFTCVYVKGLPGSGKTRFSCETGRSKCCRGAPFVVMERELSSGSEPEGTADTNPAAEIRRFTSLRNVAIAIMEIMQARNIPYIFVSDGEFFDSPFLSKCLKSAFEHRYQIAVYELFDAGGSSDGILHLQSESKTPIFTIAWFRRNYRLLYPRFRGGLIDPDAAIELIQNY